MSGRAIAWLCVLLCAPGLLGAQTGYSVHLLFAELPDYSPGIDSVYAALPGGDVPVTITSYDSFGTGLGAFTLRLYFDPARVSVMSARSSCPDSTTYPLTTATGTNYVQLSATGCTTAGYYSHNVATLHLQLKAGATDGSVLFLDPVALATPAAVDRTPDREGDLAELCHAVGLWGDVDADARVNSRDALIALSNAVGLPTPGFFISRGDVDEDGQVTSRDALAMLSVSIGLPVYGFRAGKGIADACAPQATLPRDLYFLRARSSGGAAAPGSGFGLSVRAANGTTVTVPGDSADAYPSYTWRPRVSPDGTKVLFICFNPSSYPNICVRNVSLGTVARLTNTFNIYQSPDWSPDGAQIVFVRDNQIWIMNADTTNKRRAPGDTTTTNNVSSVAWQPLPTTSHRIAYTISGSGTNGGVFTVAYDTVGSARRIVANVVSPCCVAYDALLADWSPAGDSLAFDWYVDGARVGVVAPNVSSSTAVPLLSFVGAETRDVNWTDQGLLFAYRPFISIPNLRLYLRRPSGEVVRISPLTPVQERLPGMKR